jgi:hypothetical protein
VYILGVDFAQVLPYFCCMSDVILTSEKGVRIELNAEETLALTQLLGCLRGLSFHTCYDLYSKIIDLTHPDTLNLPQTVFKSINIEPR